MKPTIESLGDCRFLSSLPQIGTEMADALEQLCIDILFVIGGDGTRKGAAALVAEIHRRRLHKSVLGIPKTIDNDIRYLDKSFGFGTAFAEAVKAVSCAHVEAIPFGIVIGDRRKIDPKGDIWRSVLESTDQPPQMSKAA
jgi:hypothetical protein